MPTARKASKPPMSKAHKQALALGRDQGRAVRRYLEALEQNKPKRGRKRTPESIKKRLAAIDQKMAVTDPLSRVHLVQERMNLTSELEAKRATVSLNALEAGFVKAAKAYGQRKGITYAAWRAVGVDPKVLVRAGVSRGR